MSYMSQNFRLFHVSNLSVLSLQFFYSCIRGKWLISAAGRWPMIPRAVQAPLQHPGQLDIGQWTWREARRAAAEAGSGVTKFAGAAGSRLAAADLHRLEARTAAGLAGPDTDRQTDRQTDRVESRSLSSTPAR